MNCAECKELLVAYVERLLEESQKQAVAEHLKDCSACRAEAKELTRLHDRLVSNGKVLAQSHLEDRVLDRIVREQNVRLKAASKAGAGLKLRRIIMKSPITKMAAAAVIIIAVLVGISQFVGPVGVTTVTFAKVIEPILNARTVIFDFIVGDEETSPVMHEIVVGSRIRRTISNLPNMTSIIDLESAKILALDTEAKTATYIDIKGSLQERTRGYIEFVRKVLMELKDSPDVEELGEQEIEGQKAIGFAGPNEEVKVWADPHTAVPIRVELRLGQLFVILKNFKFDVPVDDSLVSMDVPPGYTEETEADFSGATEQDFIESLRIWADVLMDGKFPEAIGTENTMKQVPLLGEKLAPLDLPDDEKKQLGMKFIRGMFFLQLLETEGKYHYAGKGVKLGDADKVIFWYQPKDSTTYRVIYGDLSVKDVSPENLPK